MRRITWLILAIFMVSFAIDVKANVLDDISRGSFDASTASNAQLGYYGRAPHRGGRRIHLAHRGAHACSGDFSAVASWYGGGPRWMEPNAHTASGERFDPSDLTAAHRTLPMGARLLVSYRGRTCVVRVNDRGPAAWTGRSLDLSRGAASALGLIKSGVGRVGVTVLGREG